MWVHSRCAVGRHLFWSLCIVSNQLCSYSSHNIHHSWHAGREYIKFKKCSMPLCLSNTVQYLTNCLLIYSIHHSWYKVCECIQEVKWAITSFNHCAVSNQLRTYSHNIHHLWCKARECTHEMQWVIISFDRWPVSNKLCTYSNIIHHLWYKACECTREMHYAIISFDSLCTYLFSEFVIYRWWVHPRSKEDNHLFDHRAVSDQWLCTYCILFITCDIKIVSASTKYSTACTVQYLTNCVLTRVRHSWYKVGECI